VDIDAEPDRRKEWGRDEASAGDHATNGQGVFKRTVIDGETEANCFDRIRKTVRYLPVDPGLE
jgi:hypothetical protein